VQAKFANSYFPAAPTVGTSVYIGAVLGSPGGRHVDGAIPPSCEVGFGPTRIIGSGFGTEIGTVLFGGFELDVGAWTNTVIETTWANPPFDPQFADVPLDLYSPEGEDNHIPGTARTLRVNHATSGGYDVALISTVKRQKDAYAVISSIPVGSVYTGNPDIEIGVDFGYITVTSGTADLLDAATGVVTGLSPGGAVAYSIWDPNSAEWRIG
jgi:hypothetical protein